MIKFNLNFSIIIKLILLINTIHGGNIDGNPNRESDPLPIRRTKRLIISHGEDARLDDFPWMAMLIYYRYYTVNGTLHEERSQKCAGSLINNRYILTAAHCIPKDDDEETLAAVKLGEYNTRTSHDCGRLRNGTIACQDVAVEIAINRTITYESDDGNYYDIALIKLAKIVEYNDYIRPIRLPESSHVPEMLWAAGWGLDKNNLSQEILKKVELPYYDWDDCSRLHSTLLRQEFCTEILNGKDTCTGDSGGPLMAQIDNSPSGNDWFIYGITAYGFLQCAQEGRASVNTKVYDYVLLIMENIEH